MQRKDLSHIIEMTQGLEAAPDRYKHALSRELRGGIDAAKAQILGVIWGADDVRSGTALERDAYRVLLGAKDPNPSNQLRMVPHRQDEAVVQEELSRIASKLAAKLTRSMEANAEVTTEKVTHAIRVLLNAILRERLETIGTQENFHFGDKIWRSTGHLKTAYQTARRALKKGEIVKGEATVFGLFNMGAITIREIQKKSQLKPGKQRGSREFGDYEHTELIAEIEDSLRWSREYITKMMEELQSKCLNAMANGWVDQQMNGADMPDTNSHIRTFSVFDLMEYMFEKGKNHRDYNDAQMALNFFLAHWTYQRFTGKKMTSILRKIDQRLAGVMSGVDKKGGIFEQDENGEDVRISGRQPILKFDPQTGFEMTERYVSHELKAVNVNGTRYPMYFEEMGEKTSGSAVDKLFKYDQKTRIEDVPDLTRTRMVAWTVTRKEMKENEKVRTDMEAICQLAASKLGLKEDRAFAAARESDEEIGIETLKKGYFIIEKPKPNDRFPKFGIQARLANGVPFEFQILPFDLHCLEATKGSGIAHEEYKGDLFRNKVRANIPRSVSPLTHRVLDAEEGRARALREATKTALQSQDLETAFADFMGQSEFTVPQKKAA